MHTLSTCILIWFTESDVTGLDTTTCGNVTGNVTEACSPPGIHVHTIQLAKT